MVNLTTIIAHYFSVIRKNFFVYRYFTAQWGAARALPLPGSPQQGQGEGGQGIKLALFWLQRCMHGPVTSGAAARGCPRPSKRLLGSHTSFARPSAGGVEKWVDMYVRIALVGVSPRTAGF